MITLILIWLITVINNTHRLALTKNINNHQNNATTTAPPTTTTTTTTTTSTTTINTTNTTMYHNTYQTNTTTTINNNKNDTCYEGGAPREAGAPPAGDPHAADRAPPDRDGHKHVYIL